MKRALLPVLALALSLSGCSGDDKDKESLGQASATPTACAQTQDVSTDMASKPTVTVPKGPAPTETKVLDVVCGTGAEAKEGSNVEVKYLGVLYSDGKEFDSSWSRGKDETLPFTICQQIVPGFCKGTEGMKVGGRREVIVSPDDGYGAQGAPPAIPPNATLVFVIDLVSVS